MPKKSNVQLTEVKRWLDKVLDAQQARDKADELFGYSRTLKEYAGDYTTTMPTFISNTTVVPINEVYGYVKAFIPSVYSRNPHISFNPMGSNSIGSAKVLELGVSAYWRELRLKRQIRRVIFDAIFAEGWMKTGYSAAFGSIDPEDGAAPLEANEFIRDAELFSTRVSWRHMVRDTDAVDGIHDARFVAQKIIKPLKAVQDSPLFTAKLISATHTFDPNTTIELGKPKTLPSGEREEFIEYWEIWDMDTQKIYWVSAGSDEYLREPAKWPYRFNGYPFDMLRFNQLEDECYAPNLIGPWEPQLWEKVKIRSMQMDHIKRFGRQLWAEEGSVSKSELAKFAQGQPAAVNFYKGKTPPQPSPYPQIQTDMYAIENRIDMDKDNISGQPNAVRGAQQKTQSRTLGEVKGLVSAFESRQVDPQSDVEDFCGEIAVKIAAIAQDFLPGQKWVRVTQEDIGVIKRAFGEERVDGDNFKFTRKDIENAEFEVDVKCGSSLPLDRQGRIDSMINILKLGAAIGLTPGDEVSKVIGKNLMSEFEMKEVELAFEKMLAAMAVAQKVAQASARLQQGAIEEKLARAKQLAAAQGQPQGGGLA